MFFRYVAIFLLVACVLAFLWPTLLAGGKRFRNQFTKLADNVDENGKPKDKRRRET